MGIEVILGPPGTGKTHSLLDIVDEAIDQGIDPKEIGYVSFSKRAANEARDRVQHRLPEVPRHHFQYFRTLHSLCFKQIGATRANLLAADSLADFRHFTGLDLRGRAWAAHGPERNLGLLAGRHNPTADEQALFLINLARNQLIDLHAVYNGSELGRPFSFVEDTQTCLTRYKASRSVIDYTDLLERFVDHGTTPRLRLLCIDEAQDLSALQWRVAERLMSNAESVVLAGDDDQAIFAWAGADVARFQWYARNHPARVLSQSFRVPKAVQEIADNVTQRMHDRVPKIWHPREATGLVERCDPYDLDYTKGDWLIIARTATPLMYLQKHFAVTLGPSWKHDYPRLRLSTIHGVKGAEADNVVLFTDLTKRTFSRKDEDDELRVLYVAVTRARARLFLSLPRNHRSYSV